MEFGKRQDPKRRAMGLGFVILVHVVFVWGLVNGLARKAVELLPAPIETKLLEEAVEEEEAPPPPPPKFDTPPPPFIPPPEISIQSTAPRPNAIQTSPRPPPAPAAPKPAGVTKPPVVKAKNCREPDYPAVSERLGETGTVLLALLVGVDGKVTESRVEKSSGFPRLDKAAQDALSRCKFEPGQTDGKPSQAWASLKYTFRKDR